MNAFYDLRRTRTTLALVTALLAGTLFGCSSESDSPSSSTDSDPDSTVTTELLTFEPEQLTVDAGTTVTWQAGDGVGHTVTTGTFTVSGDGLRSEESPDGVIDLPLSQEQEVTFTFDEPGTYTYYCSIHKGMNGEVVVKP